MRPVEGVNVTRPGFDRRPPRSLDSPGNFEGEFVEIVLALVPVDLPFAHEPPKIAIGGNVVEPMIVHAEMRDMRSHALNRVVTSDFEESGVASDIELQKSRPKLKPLRPFCPTSRRVFS